MEGFIDVVASAWSAGMHNADACRLLDFKLRNTAKALRAWNAKSIRSVCSQFIMARLIVGEPDIAQEARTLSDDEFALRRELKHSILALASLSRMIAR